MEETRVQGRWRRSSGRRTSIMRINPVRDPFGACGTGIWATYESGRLRQVLNSPRSCQFEICVAFLEYWEAFSGHKLQSRGPLRACKSRDRDGSPSLTRTEKALQCSKRP